jgi:transcriptional regulator with XRE-family HTH domain
MKRDAHKRLGDRIRELRLARGWTEEQLGAHAGVTTLDVSHVETGEPDVSVSTLEKLAAALDVSPAELFSGILQLSEKALEFGRAFDEVPPELQAAILAFLASLRRPRGQG